ncbi:MAG: hypothetical protein OEZ22_13750 [Spirochaetia bacterium]|nr:hypothetical protein [Spirochaetia bacterium]
MKKRIKIMITIIMVLTGLQYCNNQVPAEKIQDTLDETQNTEEQPQNTKKYLLVHTTDYTTGGLSLINLEDLSVSIDLQNPASDAVLKTIDGVPYVVNRLGADNIMRLDTASDFSIVYEQGTGTLSNPQDVEKLENGLGIVSLYAQNYLSVFDISTGVIDASKQIDISSYQSAADTDSAVEASGMLRFGDSVYIAAQNLYSWAPVSIGTLIKINATTLEATSSIEMPYMNPFSDLKHYKTESGDDWLYAVAVGNWGNADSSDGGVIAYNLTTSTFETSPLDETQAGDKDILDVLIISDTLGFVLLSDKTTYAASLSSFNPAAHTLGTTLLESNAWSMIYDNGKLYVADQNFANPGVRIFDTTTLEEITTAPINVGLPPNSMVVVEF